MNTKNNPKAILIFEKFSFFTTCAFAEKSLSLGFKTFAVVNENAPTHLKKDTGIKFIKISDWNERTLTNIAIEISKKENLAGITTILGFFYWRWTIVRADFTNR